jgi:hypothetical protein
MQQVFASPLAWPFLVGPAAVFILDRLWSFARANALLSVISAQMMPRRLRPRASFHISPASLIRFQLLRFCARVSLKVKSAGDCMHSSENDIGIPMAPLCTSYRERC